MKTVAPVLLLLALLVPARLTAQDFTPIQYYQTTQSAFSHYDAGRFDEAAELFGSLVTYDPGNGTALLWQARALGQLGNGVEARKKAVQALDQGFAQENRTALSIARGYARDGKTDSTIFWLRRAVDARISRLDIVDDDAFESLYSLTEFRSVAGLADGTQRDRDSQWAFDLDLLLEEARRLHVDPSQVAQSDEFAQSVSALKSRVSELSDDQLAFEIQKILVLLGDGHSSLWPMPNERFSFSRLPIQFYAFSDGLFVTYVYDEQYSELVGKRLSKIGGKDASGVLWSLGPYVSRDNFMGWLWQGPRALLYLEVLRDLGYDVYNSSVELTVVDEDEVETTMTVSAAAGRVSSSLQPRRNEDAMPLWLTNTETLHWTTPLPEMSAVYAQWNGVQDSEEKTIADFAQDIRRLVESGEAQNLIIDVRRNPGGNNFLIWPMVRLIGWHSESNPDNRTFVITGRGTFSACQNFVNFTSRTTDAIFVGSPSSSRPNFTGETTQVRLPYSGLLMSISSRRWQDSWPEDARPYIPVDIPVILKSSDYFSGIDPVMETLGEYLGSEK